MCLFYGKMRYRIGSFAVKEELPEIIIFAWICADILDKSYKFIVEKYELF